MIAYFDTSAYVKLILEEEGAGEVRDCFAQAPRAASSVVTLPEAAAALSRRDRERELGKSSLDTWLATLDASWRRTFAVLVGEREAARLAVAHSLRGMDAIQLAAAVTLRERMRTTSPVTEFVFATFDQRLLAAAEREGFATLGGALT